MILDEVYDSYGPTGKFQRVLQATIQDAGDNVWATVSTEEEVREFLASHRGGPYYLRAKELGEVLDCPCEGIWCGAIGRGQAR